MDFCFWRYNKVYADIRIRPIYTHGAAARFKALRPCIKRTVGSAHTEVQGQIPGGVWGIRRQQLKHFLTEIKLQCHILLANQTAA